MRRFGHRRPRPWWLHAVYGLALAGTLVMVALEHGDATTTADANGDIGSLLVGLALAFTLSLVVNPYAGPLWLGAAAVVDAVANPSSVDDSTFASAVPVVLCAGIYYAQHVWVTRRVWELSDHGRVPVDDAVRERRALVLEIGRRFLAAWLLLFGLALLAHESSAFGTNATAVFTAVRDAGGVVIVIDLLAVAPTRFWEARRVFTTHAARHTELTALPPRLLTVGIHAPYASRTPTSN